MVPMISMTLGNFYPRPPRGGRPVFFLQLTLFQVISIHALREEGDHLRCRLSLATSSFLSTPSARRATRILLNSALISLFLSTPSARRATFDG